MLVRDVSFPVEFVPMRATVRGIVPYNRSPAIFHEDLVLHEESGDLATSASKSNSNCISVRGKCVEVGFRLLGGQSRSLLTAFGFST